ncbi:MAG TPA: CHAT domain-containing protein [Thermoanaerobaculia bacterium]|nr:CHAT domain-containing protein [Thermoanaerobaculia bacterium]
MAIAAWVCDCHLSITASGRRSRISPLRAALIGALGEARFAEGRLVGFRYAPSEGPALQGCTACTVVVGTIRQRAERHPGTESLADYGVVKLAAGRLAEAVKLLEQAATRDPDNPTIENDLAAAYVAQARSERRPRLLVQALDAVARTRDSSPEALFNHALVLDYLQLRGSAIEAWHRYLAGQPEPGWWQEAQRRLAALEVTTRSEEWRHEAPRFETAAQRGDRLAVARIVGRFRQETRVLAQERWLAAWGTSHLQGDTFAARRALDAARAAGAALAEVNGEHSVADAVAAVDRLNGSPDLSAALARGHVAYARGVIAHVELRVGQARAYLVEAERQFQAAGSPATGWTVLWLAAADYYQGRHARAMQRLDHLLADPSLNRYPALRGRALWEHGMLEIQHLELGRSFADFRAALREYEAAGELENVGAVDYLLTENCELLGNTEEAWAYRDLGLRALQGYPDSIWRNNLLLEAAKDLLKAGQLRPALAFHDEQLRVARRSGMPAVLAEALLFESRLESEMGELPQASRDLTEADSITASIADHAFHERLEVEALVARCQVVGARDPAGVIAPLSQAIAYFEKTTTGNHAAFCYLLRARARLALHDTEGAERDLRIGIAAYEAARDSLESVPLRTVYLEQWQPLFDEMIQLQVDLHQPERALEFAERAKISLLCRDGARGPVARLMSTAADGACNHGGPASVVQIQRALPERSALIEYCLLPDRLLIWVVRRRSFSLSVRPVPAATLERLVETLLLGLREGLPGDEPQHAGGALSGHLLGPISSQVLTDDRLIVVPDRVLTAVPFAVLFDTSRRSYLVERQALSIEPSASFYVSRRQPPAQPPRQWRLLSVAPQEGPSVEALVPLREAAVEAAATAALYPQHRLLIGTEATRASFLAALRDSDVVEFAGHAIANLQQPPLSRLIFAADQAAAGSSLLFARDLRQLPLGHLRLVVLSGCSTAPGSRARGEGFAGATQAFLEAGAAAVLATLWRVDDAAARRLVLAFHRHLLAGEDGASALRAAQLAQLHGAVDSMRNPSGWGAFELTGALMEPEP